MLEANCYFMSTCCQRRRSRASPRKESLSSAAFVQATIRRERLTCAKRSQGCRAHKTHRANTVTPTTRVQWSRRCVQIKVNVTHAPPFNMKQTCGLCGHFSRLCKEECGFMSFVWLGSYCICFSIWVYAATYGSSSLLHCCCSSQAATTGRMLVRACVYLCFLKAKFTWRVTTASVPRGSWTKCPLLFDYKFAERKAHVANATFGLRTDEHLGRLGSVPCAPADI